MKNNNDFIKRITIIFVIITIYISTNYNKYDNIKILRKEITNIKEDIKIIEEKIKIIDNIDIEYEKEKLVRNKLKMIKNDEHIYIHKDTNREE